MHPFLSRKRRGGKRKADFPPVLPSWPMALRKVRSWLEPYVMLVRYWRAFSDLCPRPRSYESCLRGCSPERAFTSMSADNKLPVGGFEGDGTPGRYLPLSTDCRDGLLRR